MKKYINLLGFATLVASTALLFSCGGKEVSPTTGWEYNQPKNGGFEVYPYYEQETGPGLVLIEGGTFVMGRTEQDVMFDWNNIPRRVTVSSFYMDQTEVSNIAYLEYLYWLKRVFGVDYQRVVEKALPDTLVWRNKLAYNEPLVETYLRHPAYRDYPVVGVSWVQARDYCAWRTDRVNEYILYREGVLKQEPTTDVPDNYFNTDAYLAGHYQGTVKKNFVDLNPASSGERPVRMEDGILLPKYRLPTEAEWEFAALGLIGNTLYERIVERRLYPWNGHITRTDANKNYGDFVANFMRGRGDYMGVAGNLNDAADITAPVYAYWPNDYGLYNMGGNVSEWVMDVYRPLTFEEFSDFRPFRGNKFQTLQKDNNGSIAQRLDEPQYDYDGMAAYLSDFQKSLNATGYATDEEKNLVAKLITFVEDAQTAKKERRYPDAAQKIQDAIDEINNAAETVTIGGTLLKGLSAYIEAFPGQLEYRDVTIEENLNRRNYRKADNINFRDGDFASTNQNVWTPEPLTNTTKDMYDYGITSLINDKARVYKGASWKDRTYWLSPGTRRFLDENQSTDYIGFRCAMTRVGSPIGKY